MYKLGAYKNNEFATKYWAYTGPSTGPIENIGFIENGVKAKIHFGIGTVQRSTCLSDKSGNSFVPLEHWPRFHP